MSRFTNMVARIKFALTRAMRRMRSPAGRMEQAQLTQLSASAPANGRKDDNAEGKSMALCPICADTYPFEAADGQREGRQCPSCGATGRASAIAYLVGRAAYKDDVPIVLHEPDKNISVIGLSDWNLYADILDRHFDYKNTFYHKPPYLNIMAPDRVYDNSADILISSEVFEHVVGDYHDAFRGSFQVLKPGGTFVFTVPYQHIGEHIEHYPGSVDYEQRTNGDGERIVEVTYADGSKRVDEKPCFHGGQGATLEMRIFSKSEVARCLEAAGFVDIIFYEDNIESRGIHWGPPSRPITARKPA